MMNGRIFRFLIFFPQYFIRVLRFFYILYVFEQEYDLLSIELKDEYFSFLSIDL